MTISELLEPKSTEAIQAVLDAERINAEKKHEYEVKKVIRCIKEIDRVQSLYINRVRNVRERLKQEEDILRRQELAKRDYISTGDYTAYQKAMVPVIKDRQEIDYKVRKSIDFLDTDYYVTYQKDQNMDQNRTWIRTKE